MRECNKKNTPFSLHLAIDLKMSCNFCVHSKCFNAQILTKKKQHKKRQDNSGHDDLKSRMKELEFKKGTRELVLSVYKSILFPREEETTWRPI